MLYPAFNPKNRGFVMSNPELNLTVEVPADEWAYCQRRLTYLETMLLHMVRDLGQAQEWFSASDLAALRLPGLPFSREGVTARAKVARWPRRRVGKHVLYHVTCLPSRSFDALIARILDLPVEEYEPLPGVAALTVPAQGVATPNTAPAWVLPLMRLMRGEAHGSLSEAWRALPGHLPTGTVLPSVNEAATVLIDLGLAEKIVR
ncbi:DNA-binding protein [Mesorhizobium sp. M0802]|uniref:DNA-binding protein n=1 Tax=Mesorhizobium sp. M0802 TaxID=2957001 RepID=UPI00333A7E3D